MREVLVLVVVALCGLAEGSALAQEGSVDPDEEDSQPRHTITINPLGLLFGSFAVEFETATRQKPVGFETEPRRKTSLFIGPSFAYTGALAGSTTRSLLGLGATAGVRVFVGDQAPKGFWVGPQLSVFWVTGNLGSDASAFGVDVAGLLGYTWVFDSGFVLSLGGGVQYINMKVEEHDYADETRTIGVEGIFPALRLAVGFSF